MYGGSPTIVVLEFDVIMLDWNIQPHIPQLLPENASPSGRLGRIECADFRVQRSDDATNQSYAAAPKNCV
jgi:hypothetical protein